MSLLSVHIKELDATLHCIALRTRNFRKAVRTLSRDRRHVVNFSLHLEDKQLIG